MKTYDLIIAGGGPAGITAGIYSARQGLDTLLITESFGGQLTKKAVLIHNYPGFKKIAGLELAKKFEEHIKSLNIDIQEEKVLKVQKNNLNFIVSTKKKKFQGKSVIIATGAKARKLEVKGEEEFLGKGVGYCVVCDGALFAGKRVAVIGGGNTGFEAAQFLSKIAKKIYILEYSSKVKADKKNQEIIKKDKKVEILTSAQLKEIKGEQFVNSLIYKDREENKDIELKIDGVFIQAGLETTHPDLGDLVDFNSQDQIIFDLENHKTKTPGLFAAGDVGIGKFKQIVIACGEGASASLSAFNYLKDK
jgi:thioredoxin-disulfide reductase